ncbi:acyl-CoA carboxylase subunit beta [Nocardioides montaniterrae]
MTTNDALIKYVVDAKAALFDENRADKVKKQHDRGKLTARERVAYLTGGDFRELGGLAGPGPAQNGAAPLVAPGDGIVTGIGYVDGRPVAIAAFDFTVLGGSQGAQGNLKLGRMAERARIDRIPFVALMDGGGHRMQEALDSRLASPGAPVMLQLGDLNGYVPTVAAFLGPGFGAPANMAAGCDFVVIRRGAAHIGMSSDVLVKGGTGEDVTNDDLGDADLQASRGIVDLVVDEEREALDAVRLYLSYLPSWADGEPNTASGSFVPGPTAEEIDTVVPANKREAYDVRDVIEGLCDDESVFEIKPDWARNIVTALGRIEGRSVGFVANQPSFGAGAMDVAACEKAAHFYAVCDTFGVPIINLIDMPGFLVGLEAERQGLARRSGRLAYELSIATVPLIVITSRKAYGAAYVVLGGGRSLAADLSIAWPTAEICAIPVEGAVDLAFRSDWENATDPQARRTELIELFSANIDPLLAADSFGIDDILLPSETRAAIAETLRRVPRRKPSRVPDRRRTISPI